MSSSEMSPRLVHPPPRLPFILNHSQRHQHLISRLISQSRTSGPHPPVSPAAGLHMFATADPPAPPAHPLLAFPRSLSLYLPSLTSMQPGPRPGDRVPLPVLDGVQTVL
ncbi:hypothetical protein PAPYR_8028 [Paratrimastix pyriformis]|uniref:Uncharacterized protein n=1 Tax=Paratrimastix pyriformis TaxID=342808 RepID=A0ABQ8UBQ3_9EUKA|nr:hypothetical protein PAPYR_8028 [Paratrimastix pyriformis]